MLLVAGGSRRGTTRNPLVPVATSQRCSDSTRAREGRVFKGKTRSSQTDVGPRSSTMAPKVGSEDLMARRGDKKERGLNCSPLGKLFPLDPAGSLREYFHTGGQKRLSKAAAIRL